MIRVTALALAAVLFLLPGTTRSQEPDCANAADQATLNACADASLKKADAELNALYRQITGRLDPEGRAHLVAAQRAWIAFRDAECKFAASAVEGGSAYPMVHADCLASLTEARIADFKAYLACGEGDLSCPVPPGG